MKDVNVQDTTSEAFVRFLYDTFRHIMQRLSGWWKGDEGRLIYWKWTGKVCSTSKFLGNFLMCWVRILQLVDWICIHVYICTRYTVSSTEQVRDHHCLPYMSAFHIYLGLYALCTPVILYLSFCQINKNSPIHHRPIIIFFKPNTFEHILEK